MRLHACIHLFVGEIDAVMDKRLTHLVQSSIVQVLRLESRFVNHAVARVTFPDAMLFNELHGVSPLCISLLCVLMIQTLSSDMMCNALSCCGVENKQMNMRIFWQFRSISEP